MEGGVRLKNKIALVIGAASGMGESAARIFAREGAKVVVADVLEKEGAAVAASIVSAGGEAIVNLSSISGFVGQEFVHMGYNGAKAAIRMMTKSAAVQYAKDGIRVNSVHPGVMPPMRTSVTAADPKLREKVLESVPMRRPGRVEEAAYAILFLASDEASYITGTELVVDGGFLAV